MLPSRFSGPSSGFFIHNDSRGGHFHRPPFPPPPHFNHHWGRLHPPHYGPPHRPWGPHLRPHGPPSRECPLRGWTGGRGGRVWGRGQGWCHRGPSPPTPLIAATYHLARHLWLGATGPQDDDDIPPPHHGSGVPPPFPPPPPGPPRPSAPEPDTEEPPQHHAGQEGNQEQQEDGEDREQNPEQQGEKEQKQKDCDVSAEEVWVEVGGEVWTAELPLGPFTPGEVEVESDGETWVEVRATHRHGDILVASMSRRLPPPPADAPFTVSHAHTPPTVLLTASRVAHSAAAEGTPKNMEVDNDNHANETK